MVNISATLLAMGVPVANTTPAAAVRLIWMWRTFKNISKARSMACLRQPGDARHFGDVKQILEIVRLVHKQPVNAEFLERQRVVLLVVRRRAFQAWFPVFSWRVPVPSPVRRLELSACCAV